jgi:hypothetical protein
MSEKMVTLAVFGNPVEAELVRAELEAEGIRAHIIGTTSGDLFAGMGVGVSQLQLLVPEGDYERAAELFREESDVARESRRNREEEQETAIREPAAETGSTDIRPAVEGPVAADPLPATSPSAGEASDAADELPDEEGDEREERSLTLTADDIAVRAFRLALFGYIILPGVGQLCALWLILRLPFVDGELSPRGSRYAYAALALALLPFLVLILILCGAR